MIKLALPVRDQTEEMPRTGVLGAVRKANHVIDRVFMFLFHLRKPLLAAPIVYYALKLADYCRANLPEQVGLGLQITGEFTKYIGRETAVTGCLALTAGCLAMMFLSRKVWYTWFISAFTLTLPVLLVISNIYPN